MECRDGRDEGSMDKAVSWKNGMRREGFLDEWSVRMAGYCVDYVVSWIDGT